MRARRTEAGYSLIETLVAVAMVAGIAMLATSLNPFAMRGERTNYHRVCESIANSMISVVQERGPLEAIEQFTPVGPLRIMNAYPSGINPRGTAAATDFFTSPSGASFFTIVEANPAAGVSPFINNYQEIRGSVRTATAIYNNTPGVRCAWANFAPVNVDLTRVQLPVQFSTLGANIQIRLDPFNTTTGNTVACAANITPLHIAPPGRSPGGVGDGFTTTVDPIAAHQTDFTLPNSAVSPAPVPPAIPPGRSVVRRATNGTATVRSDLGVQMRARVDLPDIQGERIVCEASQRFQYSADRTAPTAGPTVTIGTNSSTLLPTSAGDKCSRAGLQNVTITISYAAAPEPGTQLICRDMSARRGYQISANSQSDTVNSLHSIPCVYQQNVDQSPLEQNLVHSLDDTTYPPTEFTQRGQNLAFAEVWRPCDSFSICGERPTAVAAVAPPGVGYQLTYRLPQGCLINLEAVGVDTAGNLSPVGAFTASAVNMTPGGLILPGSENSEVYKPVCGWDIGNYYYYKPRFGTYCKPMANPADDDTFAGHGPYETFNWRRADPSIPGSIDSSGDGEWITEFPNGYYTCRGQPGFPLGGDGTPGCCSGTGCTPFN